MKLASKLISEADRVEISAAITEAEKSTSGEIVPVIATVSGRYDRAEDIFGMVIGLVAVSISWLFFQDIQPAPGDWATGQQLTVGLLPILLILVLGFALGSGLATYFPVFRLPFIPKREMREEVERSAAEAFHRFRVRKTAAGTGILIYISLYERMVRIQGDDSINAEMEQEAWEAVLELVIEGIKDDRPAEGIRRAVLRCGELLGRHFPIQPDDINEISNEVHTIDQYR